MMKLAVIGLVVAGAVAQTSAQDTVTVTDRASNLNIALTGYVQGAEGEGTMSVDKIRITSKDILNFGQGGRGARLLVITPVDYDGDTRVIIRENVTGGTAETDLTGFFDAQTIALVEDSKTRNDKVTGKQYSIDRFVFAGTDEEPTPVSFDVQGFTTANLSNGSFSSNVNGTGSTAAGDGVVTGKISATGGKTETRTIEVEGE